MELIRSANPFPDELPAPPIEEVWLRLDEGDGQGPGRGSVGGPAPASAVMRLPGFGGVMVAVSTVLAVAVAVFAIVLLGHGRSRRPVHPPVVAGSPLAVFRRPQTDKDRSLPALVRRAATLGGLGNGFVESVLAGTIPSQTRYIETLPDTREVFLTVLRNTFPQSLLPRHRPGGPVPRVPAGEILVRLVIVQPDGKWIDGQPVVSPTLGSVNNRIAYIDAVGGGGCSLDTHWSIVPNRVARVRWQFPRQDSYGFIYNAPLTVNIPVRGNVAVATIPARASCDHASVVTLYGPSGQVLGHHGSAANLNRITRPIRHGNPSAALGAVQHDATLTELIDHFAVFRRSQATVGEPPAVPGGLADQALRRYVPIAGSFGVWLTIGSDGACIDLPLAPDAKPQTGAGGCNSNLADVEVGGLFGEERDALGTNGPTFVGMVPDDTKSVTITLANGHVETPTPHDNVFSVAEPSASTPPFRLLRIESDSGHVSTWCPSCTNGR